MVQCSLLCLRHGNDDGPENLHEAYYPVSTPDLAFLQDTHTSKAQKRTNANVEIDLARRNFSGVTDASPPAL